MSHSIFDFVEAAFQTAWNRARETDIELSELVARSERSGVTFSLRQYTLDSAPTASDKMTSYAMAVISDGRKPGEAAGNGTGVVAMYDVLTDKWLRTSDYSEVIT